MKSRLYLLTLFALLMTVGLSCCASAQKPETRKPEKRQEPAPLGSREGDFRAVDVFIHVDLDSNHIEVEPDPNDPNVLYGIERIFYRSKTPDENMVTPPECRPENPARQVRWVVRCKDSNGHCERGEHRVVIRPKAASDRLGLCDREGVNNIPYEIPECPWENPCCLSGTEADPPPELLDPEVAGKYPEKKRQYDSYIKGHKKEQRAHDDALAEEVFSVGSEGVFAIPVTHGERRERCDGAVLSGLPNVRKFHKGGSSYGWHYTIELWHGDRLRACLDPPVWIEGDGGPAGG